MAQLDAPRSSVLVEAFSASGAPITTLALAANAESFSVAAPPNTYVVRVRNVGAGLVSPPSNTVSISVPAACATPAAPVGLTANVVGSVVTVSWRLGPEGSAAPTGYVLEAGFGPASPTRRWSRLRHANCGPPHRAVHTSCACAPSIVAAQARARPISSSRSGEQWTLK